MSELKERIQEMESLIRSNRIKNQVKDDNRDDKDGSMATVGRMEETMRNELRAMDNRMDQQMSDLNTKFLTVESDLTRNLTVETTSVTTGRSD